MSLAQSWNDLIVLTKDYLAQEFESRRWTFASEGDLTYFRQFASKPSSPPSKLPAAPLPKPLMTPESPPILPKPIKAAPPPPEPEKPIVASEPEPHREKAPFRLDPPPSIAHCDFSSIKQAIKSTAPLLVHLDSPPEPKPKSQKQNSVITLSFSSEESPFLETLTKAISEHIAPSRLVNAQTIAKRQAWQQLIESPHVTLIIAPENELLATPELQAHYRFDTDSNRHFLGLKPCLLLNEAAYYQADPKRKHSLWNAIKAHV